MTRLVCEICGYKFQQQDIYRVREMLFGFRDTFDYLLCIRCKCLQIGEAPIDLEKYYPQTYYSFHEAKTLPPRHMNKVKGRLFHLRNEAALFKGSIVGNVLSRVLPLSRAIISEFNEKMSSAELRKRKISFKSRVLDVGCGAGKYLRYLSSMGFKRLTGVDPYIKEDIVYPEGVHIYKKAIFDLDDEFDLIMLHDSFEHVPDPRAVLRAVERNLFDGGLCVIRMPVLDCFAWEKYGVNWMAIDAPRHLFIYSQSSLQILLEETNLKLEAVIYDSTGFQFWTSEQYLRDISFAADNSYGVNPERSIFSAEEIRSFYEKAKELNRQKLGDHAAFYISKVK